MIINETLRATQTAIETLPWVERFGGVAIPIRRDEGGTDVNGKHVPLYKTYPVSDTLTNEECFRDKMYKRLIPDSKMKNLLYWEVTGPAKPVSLNSTPPKAYSVQGSARLVYWLNLPKHGIGREDEYRIGSVGVILAKTLEGKHPVRTGLSMVLSDPTYEAPEPKRIFPYDYDFSDALLLYPNGFGAVSFTVTVHIRPNCLPDLATATPILCP